MELEYFSRVNLDRCQAENGFNHPLEAWSLSDWLTATAGELGEAANIVKKLNRVRDGIPGNKETTEELQAALGKELADVFCYLDLMIQAAGFSTEEVVRAKFNEVSDRVGYPHI